MANMTDVSNRTFDECTDECIFQTVKGKPNVAIVVFTAGDVFGGYSSVVVTERGKLFDDAKMFIFSFTFHWLCMSPQRFDVKECVKVHAGVNCNKKL